MRWDTPPLRLVSSYLARTPRATLLRGAAAIVVALVLLGLLISRFYSATHTVATIEHQGQGVIGQLVGHTAPDFTVTLWNGTPGEKIHLAALHGRVVVVNFWASWCEPCHGEAPVLASVAHQYAAKDVVFIGIALETQDTDGLDFIHQYHVPYECGPAPDSLAVAYALTGIPVTVTINAQGVIEGQIDGPVTAASLDSAIHRAGN
jgi:cytochrome c biogenesis protein CcmG/thiol:disulfide interchange protein DsbE